MTDGISRRPGLFLIPAPLLIIEYHIIKYHYY